MFAHRLENVSASGIRKIFELATQVENPINLSIGQPDFDVPAVIKQAAIRAIENNQNTYTVTQGIEELRLKISESILQNRGRTPESVFVSSGVSGGLFLAMMALVNPGDEVIVPDPYFVVYKNLIHLVEGIPKYYNLYPDFEIKAEKIESLITEKTKLLILNSPSNPTGSVISKETLVEIAEIAEKHNLIIVSDEIYSSFVYDEGFSSIYSYYPRTILLDGYSKSYGMPGWRMGYVAGPSDILAKMSTLQQFSFVCAPSFAQHACLEVEKVDMTPWVKSYKKKRDFVYEALLRSGYQVTKPRGSFYIYPSVPWGTDEEFCQAAVERSLLMIPGSAFSSQNTHFRISFAASDDTLEKGVDVLAQISQPPKK